MSELSMLHPVFNNVPNEIKELSTLSLKKARFLIVTWSPSNVSNAKTHISNDRWQFLCPALPLAIITGRSDLCIAGVIGIFRSCS
jgi:uncharacterized protein YchJ